MAGLAAPRIIRVVMRLASRLDDEVVGDLMKRWCLIHNRGSYITAAVVAVATAVAVVVVET